MFILNTVHVYVSFSEDFSEIYLTFFLKVMKRQSCCGMLAVIHQYFSKLFLAQFSLYFLYLERTF